MNERKNSNFLFSTGMLFKKSSIFSLSGVGGNVTLFLMYKDDSDNFVPKDVHIRYFLKTLPKKCPLQ